MILKLRFIFLAFVIVLFFPFGVRAGQQEAVILKNGDVYRGVIIEQEFGKYIQIQFRDGNEKRILWDSVATVRKESARQQRILAQTDVMDGAMDELSDESAFGAAAVGESPQMSRRILYRHELALSGLNSTVTFGSGNTAVSLGVAYQYLIARGVQLGVTSQYEYSNLGVGMYGVGVTLGPTINIPFKVDVRDSFFIAPQMGLLYANYGRGSVTKTMVTFGLGKRFMISENISYQPSFNFQKIEDTNVVFVLSLLAFSWHL